MASGYFASTNPHAHGERHPPVSTIMPAANYSLSFFDELDGLDELSKSHASPHLCLPDGSFPIDRFDMPAGPAGRLPAGQAGPARPGFAPALTPAGFYQSPLPALTLPTPSTSFQPSGLPISSSSFHQQHQPPHQPHHGFKLPPLASSLHSDHQLQPPRPVAPYSPSPWAPPIHAIANSSAARHLNSPAHLRPLNPPLLARHPTTTTTTTTTTIISPGFIPSNSYTGYLGLAPGVLPNPALYLPSAPCSPGSFWSPQAPLASSDSFFPDHTSHWLCNQTDPTSYFSTTTYDLSSFNSFDSTSAAMPPGPRRSARLSSDAPLEFFDLSSPTTAAPPPGASNTSRHTQSRVAPTPTRSAPRRPSAPRATTNPTASRSRTPAVAARPAEPSSSGADSNLKRKRDARSESPTKDEASQRQEEAASLLKLGDFSDHPDLEVVDLCNTDQVPKHLLAKPKPKNEIKLDAFQCVICMDNATDLTVTHCGHLFCGECLFESLHTNPSKHICPVCRSKIDKPTAGAIPGTTKPFGGRAKGYHALKLKIMTRKKGSKTTTNS